MIKLQGLYELEHWRAGRLIDQCSGFNGIKNGGKEYLLNAAFVPATTQEQQYVALALSTFVSDDADDTNAEMSGYEFVDYSEAARVTWTATDSGSETESGSTYRYVQNATAMTFTMTGAGTLGGFFVTGNSVKSSYTTSTVLWSSAVFAATKTVAAADVIKIVYKVRTLAS